MKELITKQLVCEMCGNVDLVKHDGMFVCQSCGAKYSVEEAKKIMVEKRTDDDNTIKVEEMSDELSNLYKLARMAVENKDDKNAAKYYDIIKQKNPNDWEAVFYVAYYDAKYCDVEQINSCFVTIRAYMADVLRLINENVAEEKKTAYLEVTNKIVPLYIIMYYRFQQRYSSLEESSDKNLRNVYGLGLYGLVRNFYHFGDLLESLFGDEEAARIAAGATWKQGVEAHAPLLKYLQEKEPAKNEMATYVGKIKKTMPDYEAPESSTSNSSSSGGCYVATAIYGSYDCPEVWTLRRYRDNTLASTWYGRAFIRIYYAVSPTLVKWFGNTAWFKKMWHGKLERMVKKLNEKGVENTPYEDKIW